MVPVKIYFKFRKISMAPSMPPRSPVLFYRRHFKGSKNCLKKLQNQNHNNTLGDKSNMDCITMNC